MPYTSCPAIFDSANGQRERRSIVEELMDKLATPMFFTSITTAAGFLSLSLVPIPPVQVFGVFVALGVMLAWLLSISFIPAYILLLNLAQLPRFGPAERGNDSMLGRSMLWFGRCTQRYHYLILAAALLCTALGVYGIMQIRINDNPVRWFGQTHPIRVADAVLNRHFGGTYMAYLTLRPGDMETTLQDYRAELRPRIKAAAAEWALDRHQAALLAAFQTNLDSTEAGSISALLAELSTDVERRLDSADGDDLVLWDAIAGLLEAERQRLQVFKQPEVLEYMLALQTHLLETGIVGKSVSVADFVRTVHRELMSGEADAYRIPDRADAVAQTLVSYQNSHRPEDLWRFVTPDFTMANLWVLLRSGDNRDMKVVMDAVGAFLAAHPPPYHLQHEWFGLTYINVAWQEKMVSGMQQALLSGFLFVLIMMVLLLRSALWGGARNAAADADDRLHLWHHRPCRQGLRHARCGAVVAGVGLGGRLQHPLPGPHTRSVSSDRQLGRLGPAGVRQAGTGHRPQHGGGFGRVPTALGRALGPLQHSWHSDCGHPDFVGGRDTAVAAGAAEVLRVLVLSASRPAPHHRLRARRQHLRRDRHGGPGAGKLDPVPGHWLAIAGLAARCTPCRHFGSSLPGSESTC